MVTWVMRILIGLSSLCFIAQAYQDEPNRQAHLSRQDLETQLAGHQDDVVLRFGISTAEEAKVLADTVNSMYLDVWESNIEWADIRVSKKVVPTLLDLLPESLRKAHTSLIPDLHEAILNSYPTSTHTNRPQEPANGHSAFNPSLRSSPSTTNIFFADYQPLSVIHPWMRLLQSLFPTHVRIVNIGKSFEGREILALRVGVHPTNSEKPQELRKTIVVSGGTHAREWISTAAVAYGAYSMVTAYGKVRKTTKLMEEFDWIFIPTMNPDGYVYTWESDRLWRKNRQDTHLRFCKGVDLDRSYSFQWDGESTKGNPCSESFAGSAPFEGVESQRFANWVKNETDHNNASFVGFLDLHSYSQQVLYPFAYSCIATPPTLENLEELGLGIAKAIRIADSKNYGVTSACEGGVTVSDGSKRERKLWPRMESGGGSALDYMYHEMQVRYAFQLKLRDRGSYGFLLPSKNIVPTGEEVFSAITYFGNYLLGNKGIETMNDSPSTEGSVVFKKMDDSEDFKKQKLELR